MTYILERHFELDDDNNIVPSKCNSVLVRPVNWDYKTTLEFMLGKGSNKTMTLGGQIAYYEHSTKIGHKFPDAKSFDNIEEWLIWLSLNHNINVDFDDYELNIYPECKTYIIKTIDLHTHQVVQDYTKEIYNFIAQRDKVNKSTEI